MARKEKKILFPAGPLLDKPRVLLREPHPVFFHIFYTLLVFLGCAASLGSFFTAFQAPVSLGPAAAVGGLCSLYCVFLFRLKKYVWPAALSGAALWLWALYSQFDPLCQGILYTANQILDAYGKKLNMSLPTLISPTPDPVEPLVSCTTFACFLILPVAWMLSWLLVSRKSFLGAFLFTGIFLLAPMAISIVPNVQFFHLLLLFWIFLLLTAPFLGQRHRLLETRKGYHAGGDPAVRLSTLWLLPAAALCMALVSAAFPEQTYQRPKAVNELRSALSDGLQMNSLFSSGTGSGNSRVDLRSLGERRYTGKTVLQVKYDWHVPKQPLGGSLYLQNARKDYLKSFVGSVYTGHSWEPLDREGLSELDRIWEPRESLLIPATFAELLPAASIDTGQSYRLSVKNIAGNSQCVYLPYGPTRTSLDQLNCKPAADGYVKSSHWLTGSKEYDLFALGLPGNFSYTFRFADSYVQANGVDQLDRIYSSLNPSQQAAADSQDVWKVPEAFQDGLEPRAWDYLKEVEAYTEFVYSRYTQLPEDLRPILESFVQEHGLTGDLPPEEEGYEDDLFIQNLCALLASDYTYSLSPPAVPLGRDFVEYFLTESKTGYCVHFATAAVALLRSQGIPARYAEGYGVPSGKDGKWVNVPDRNAHAWVEIYSGGVGWLPLEVTPPSPDSPAAYEDATYHEELVPVPTDRPQERATPSPGPSAAAEEKISPSPSASPSHSPAPGGALPQEEKPPVVPPWVWISLSSTALFLGGLWFNRSLRQRLRDKELSQEDRSKAGLKAYARLLKLFELALPLPGPRVKRDPKWEEIALKARFSSHPLTEEELGYLTSACAHFEKLLKRYLPLPKKLLYEYIFGLL